MQYLMIYLFTNKKRNVYIKRHIHININTFQYSIIIIIAKLRAPIQDHVVEHQIKWLQHSGFGDTPVEIITPISNKLIKQSTTATINSVNAMVSVNVTLERRAQPLYRKSNK